MVKSPTPAPIAPPITAKQREFLESTAANGCAPATIRHLCALVAAPLAQPGPGSVELDADTAEAMGMAVYWISLLSEIEEGTATA